MSETPAAVAVRTRGSERPDTIHGRLMEAVHIAGYTTRRALAEFKWLLQEDRWKEVGDGYDDINDFTATINWSEFKWAVEDRKEIAQLLAEKQASQRATARMLGVSHTTVRRDAGTNVPPPAEEPKQDGPLEKPTGTHVPPAPPLTITASPAQVEAAVEAKAKQEERNAGREERRTKAAETAVLTGRYSVILADPPWRYHATTVTGSAEHHYPTMATEDICTLVKDEHLTEDAALFLWATNPLLPDALRVVAAWGFEYRTNIVWVKDKPTTGLGFHVRGQHELLLVATRGRMLPETRPPSVLSAIKAQHSQKPGEQYSIVESMYPDQRYLELFARPPHRDGWEVWGNES